MTEKPPITFEACAKQSSFEHMQRIGVKVWKDQELEKYNTRVMNWVFSIAGLSWVVCWIITGIFWSGIFPAIMISVLGTGFTKDEGEE